MRFTSGIFALLVATALILSGCLQVPEEDNSTADGDDDGLDGDQNTDEPRDSGKKGGNGDPGGNQTEEEDKECYDYDPPKAAPPQEQPVDSEDDIECAGQYTVTSEGSGESWSVPQWQVDDWWRYEIEVSYTGGSQCMEEEITVLDDSQTSSDVPIYTVEIQRYTCEGEEQGDPTQENRTQDSLQRLHEDGYVDQKAIFPFGDGKSWVYMMKGNGNIVDMGPIEYDDSYEGYDGDPTTSVKAWHVEWELGENGEVQYRQSWSPDVKYLLEEEMVTSGGGVTVEMTKTLLDSNYELEEDSLLPGVPRLP